VVKVILIITRQFFGTSIGRQFSVLIVLSVNKSLISYYVNGLRIHCYIFDISNCHICRVLQWLKCTFVKVLVRVLRTNRDGRGSVRPL
jgi:hypothetical protein